MSSSVSLRDLLQTQLQDALGRVDLSSLRPELHEVALADFAATVKTKAVLCWIEEPPPQSQSDPNLDDLLAECFDDLMTARLDLMEACLAYADEYDRERSKNSPSRKSRSLSHENVVGYFWAREAVHRLQEMQLNGDQLVAVLNAYFIGTTSVTLQAPILKSISYAEARTGVKLAWHTEVEEMCRTSGTRKRDTILDMIEKRAFDDESVFVEVDWENEVVCWELQISFKTKKDSQALTEFSFSTLQHFLYRLKL